MAADYTVKQGDHIAKIAAKYGFADYLTIWDHPDNAELKQLRKNPNILLPGDILHIPDKQQKQVSCKTSQLYSFKVSSKKIKIRIILKNLNNKLITDTPCELQIDGKTYNLTSDSNGLIEQEISSIAEEGTLTVKESDSTSELKIPVKMGHLDPVEEATGQQSRLNNLGYYAGEIGKIDELELKSAIEEFQCDNGLTVNGVCEQKTQAKLIELYGC